MSCAVYSVARAGVESIECRVAFMDRNAGFCEGGLNGGVSAICDYREVMETRSELSVDDVEGLALPWGQGKGAR